MDINKAVTSLIYKFGQHLIDIEKKTFGDLFQLTQMGLIPQLYSPLWIGDYTNKPDQLIIDVGSIECRNYHIDFSHVKEITLSNSLKIFTNKHEHYVEDFDIDNTAIALATAVINNKVKEAFGILNNGTTDIIHDGKPLFSHGNNYLCEKFSFESLFKAISMVRMLNFKCRMLLISKENKLIIEKELFSKNINTSDFYEEFQKGVLVSDYVNPSFAAIITDANLGLSYVQLKEKETTVNINYEILSMILTNNEKYNFFIGNRAGVYGISI